jgi:hypothetical protein
LAVFGVQDLLQFAYSFSQLPDLQQRFFLTHARRLIGVNVGKADFLARLCGNNVRFHLSFSMTE